MNVLGRILGNLRKIQILHKSHIGYNTYDFFMETSYPGPFKGTYISACFQFCLKD